LEDKSNSLSNLENRCRPDIILLQGITLQEKKSITNCAGKKEHCNTGTGNKLTKKIDIRFGVLIPL
jgi:hypothetical protein